MGEPETIYNDLEIPFLFQMKGISQPFGKSLQTGIRKIKDGIYYFIEHLDFLIAFQVLWPRPGPGKSQQKCFSNSCAFLDAFSK